MQYIFRGLVIIDYDEINKQITMPKQDGMYNFDLAKFITEDYMLLAKFFENCYLHNKYDNVELTDIVVD